MNTVLINGKAYDWNDLTVVFGEYPVFGITSINYSEKQDIKPIYNDNVFPIGYGLGKVTVTANVTIDYTELMKLKLLSYSNTVQNLQFDIIITFLNTSFSKDEHAVPSTVILKNCRISNVTINNTQNSPNTYATLNLVVSHILQETDAYKDKILEPLRKGYTELAQNFTNLLNKG